MARGDVNHLINQILTNGFEYKQWYKNFKKPMPYEGKKLSKEQLKTLKKFKEYYELKPSSKGGTIKPTSVLNALQGLRYLGFHINKPYEKATTKDLISFFKELQESGKSESTISNFKVTVRSFYKWMHGIKDKHKFPPIVDHELLVPQRPKPSKHRSPDNFLTKDEIIKMLNSCVRLRDKVIIMLTYGEGSLRAGEVVSLNYGSVRFSDSTCTIFIQESKTKERKVFLVDSFPYLRDYINNEYALDKKRDNPLFYGVATNKVNTRINRNTITGILKRIAKRAGINKNVFCHMGRHQSVTQFARDGLSLAINAKRAGINIDTLHRVYLHHDDKDVEDAILAIKGGISDKDKVLKAEEKKKLSPKQCVRCDKINPPSAVTCHCGAYLNLKDAEEAERKKEEINKSLVEEMFKNNAGGFMEEMMKQFIESGEAGKLLTKVKKK
jgi:integrase/recombinase XerD